MSDATRHGDPRFEALVEDLVADLRPVTRLRPPWRRALIWLALVAGLAIVLALRANLPAVGERLMAAPDMWLSVIGEVTTAALAVIAAFELSLPDRQPTWGLLPLPSLILWIAASGLGCARAWLIPGTHDAALGESKDCLFFIIGLSVPLSLVLFAMLRQGYSMRPSLTAGLAGLAAAAAAAALLTFFHPYDASASDLLVHAGTVAFLVIVNRVCGRALLRQRRGGTATGSRRA